MKLRKKRAFSLTEILVTTAIFAIALGAIYGVLYAGNNASKVYDSNISIQREIRNALSLMVKEFREANAIDVTPGEDSVTVNFNRLDIGSITYSWSSSGDNANSIIRTLDDNDIIIAQHISALSFTEGTSSITIDITATRATGVAGTDSSISLTEKVALRS